MTHKNGGPKAAIERPPQEPLPLVPDEEFIGPIGAKVLEL